MTNPSRWRSKGRLARHGSSSAADIALMSAKEPNVSGASGASTPPASMSGVWPSRTRRKASPIAIAPEAQELLLARLGPRRPMSMATLLGAAPPNTDSASDGLTSPIPPVMYAWCCSSAKATPPSADPM